MKSSASVLVVFLFFAWSAAQIPLPTTPEQDVIDTGAEDATSSSALRAASWIRQLRNANCNWGSQTDLALLALSQDPSWNASEPESLVSLQQVDIQFLLQRLRDPHRKHFSWDQRVHLAQLLIAHCKNPSSYYDFDLLEGLLDERPHAGSFEYASKMLTVCSGNGNITKSHVKRLMRKMADHNNWINQQEADSLSMVMIAASCVASRYGYSSLLHYASDLPEILMKLQSMDGSFHSNVISTALVIQALQVEGLDMNTNQTIESAKKWLMSTQNGDGSFGDLLSTTEAMLALSPSGGRSFLHLGRCFLGQDLDNVTEPASEEDLEMIHFHLVLWIGQPVKEQHVVKLRAPVNTTVLQALATAAEIADNFQFEYRDYSFGTYITSIKNVTEDRAASMGWLVYVLPSFDVHHERKDATRVHKFQATQGVSQIPVKDEDYVLFWYKLIGQE